MAGGRSSGRRLLRACSGVFDFVIEISELAGHFGFGDQLQDLVRQILGAEHLPVAALQSVVFRRRLRPFQGAQGKRLVKSPKVYVRDSGLLHALLGIGDYNQLSGHPVLGASWEGFVIENLIGAAPDGVAASFYRTAAGAQIDLVLEIPGRGPWAIEIKRGLTARPERGFHIACEDLQPSRRFVVNGGQDRYPLGPDLEAISLQGLARELAGL